MGKLIRHRGFSLTEILIAMGILAVGMSFVAGVFPVAIHLTTVATERTIATVASDEAFAKIKLYAERNPDDLTDGIRIDQLHTNALTDFNDSGIWPLGAAQIDGIFSYSEQYYWSALCRRTGIGNSAVQITVFISRKGSNNLQYLDPGGGTVDWPQPLSVAANLVAGYNNKLQIAAAQKTYINDGSIIVDDGTGEIYHVLERYAGIDDDKILLDRLWQGLATATVWVVPPPINGSGKSPCVAVYQKIMNF